MSEKSDNYIDPEIESAGSMARNLLIGLGVAAVGTAAVVAARHAISKRHESDAPSKITDKVPGLHKKFSEDEE